MKRATGPDQTAAIVDALTDWQCLDITIGIVFDNNAANTGKYTGCCVGLEKAKNKALLWLACRYHVYEAHIKHAAQHIRGGTNGPSDGRFQKEFPSIDLTKVNLLY